MQYPCRTVLVIYRKSIPNGSDLYEIRKKFVNKYGHPNDEIWQDKYHDVTNNRDRLQYISMGYKNSSNIMINGHRNGESSTWYYEINVFVSQHTLDAKNAAVDSCVKNRNRKKAKSVDIP